MSQTLPRRTLTEEVAEFLARGPSAEDIANFHISEQAQERVHALMEKNEAGALTAEENAELDEITVLDQLFTLIRAHRASQTQTHNGHAG